MKCGHYDAHKCAHCGQCNACKHSYSERILGGEVSWWKKCPTLKIVKVIAARMQS